MKMQIKDLHHDPANVRKHGQRNHDAIKASLQRFGQQKPIVVGEGNIVIAGNGTLAAARDLGWKEIEVVQSQLVGAEATAFAIADNRTAELAEWDDDALAETLAALQNDDTIDHLAAGFSDDEIADLIAESTGMSADEVEEDEVPEPPADPVTKPGDLWILGEHRVLCGDSTNADDVARLMNGEKADLCFTSPPYGQQRDYTEEGKEMCSDWDGLMRGVFGNLPMSDAGQVLVNLGMIHREGEWLPYWDEWIAWMREQGWRRFGWYVWDQGAGMPGDWNGRLAPSHEFIWHFNKESVKARKARQCKHAGDTHGGSGMRGKDGLVKSRSAGRAPIQDKAIHDSIFRVNRQGSSCFDGDHPAPYPVGLPSLAMQSWDGLAYEPFCGSGTTLIAAEKLGRKCYGMEISPQYCDVIVQRWENLTGKKAVLDG